MAAITRPPQAFERRRDFHYHFTHYRQLFWRTKWYLLVACIVLTIAALFVFLEVASPQPKLSATVLIGVENTSDMSAVKDVSGLMEAQSDLILSRTFLRNIVKEQSLQFALDKYPRGSIFDTVKADSQSVPGTYAFRIDPKKPEAFVLYFMPGSNGITLGALAAALHPKPITRGRTALLTTMDLTGMHMAFSRQFISAPYNFTFSIQKMQNAVEDLYSSVTVKETETKSGVSNISLSIQSRDYQLASQTANSIADAFVKKNMAFKKQRTHSVLASLEKQIETVSKDLSTAESGLRTFRTANPTVGLTENTRERITDLSDLEKGVVSAKRNLEDAKALKNKYSAASSDDKLYIAGEIVGFLGTKEVSSATMFQNELNALLAEQRELERSYASDHPLRRECERKIENLKDEIASSLQNYIASTQGSITNRSSQLESRSGELQNLPSKELQLAQLEQRQQIASDIYKAVITRYNEAKAADVGEVAETYVMDYAVAPIPPPINVPKLAALFIAGILLLLFLPVVLWNSWSHKVYTDYEFVQKTGKFLLETIPQSKNLSKPTPHDEGAAAATENPPFMAMQDQHGIVQEIFRGLRTKVLAKLYNSPEKSLVVTSLDPRAGKSTIAANLACAIAQQNLKTLLIDADLRCGTLHASFGKKQKPGLSEFLDLQSGATSDAITSIVQATFIPNLFFISSGEPKLISSELLASDRFKHLKRELTKLFPVIIVDAPPLGPVIDAAVIDPLSSVFLVIARAGMTDVLDLTKRIAEFPGIDQNIIGYILNFASMHGKLKYSKYSKYYSPKKQPPAPKNQVWSIK